MRSRWLPWLVAMPTVATGLLAGHFVGSLLAAEPVREVAEGTLERSGHGSAAVVFGFFAVMVLVASVVLAGCLRKRDGFSAPPMMLFFTLPVLAWPMQEILERALHSGSGLGLHPLTDPSLLLGVVLQIPFSIAAYALARFLFKIIIKIAKALRHKSERRRPTSIRSPRIVALYPRTRIAALRHAQRAPPRLAYLSQPI